MSADATNVVDVFDSNVWVLALTESSTKAEILLEEILEDERTVAVSPYVFVEVLDAFAHELNSREQVDGYQTAFATIVADSSSIEGPAQDDIERTDLDAVRDSGEATFIPRILSIQTKDVPIVLSAWSYYDRDPTIFTADRSFATLDPERYGLERMSVEHVDPSTRRTENVREVPVPQTKRGRSPLSAAIASRAFVTG